MSQKKSHVAVPGLALLVGGLVLGYVLGTQEPGARGQSPPRSQRSPEQSGNPAESPQVAAAKPEFVPNSSALENNADYTTIEKDVTLPDTPAAYDPDWQRPYPQYQPLGEVLKPFPQLKPGDRAPFKLYKYGGRSEKAYASTDDIKDFESFYQKCVEQKDELMADWHDYLDTRYNFTGETSSEVTMTGGKPIPLGPVVRLPEGVSSWEELAAMSPEEIRKEGLFPEGLRPLAHPMHTTGHMVFPPFFTDAHPEFKRFDVEFDIPNAYLPDFPPPLFLTTRPDMGDVSRGKEITLANYRELFEGVINPEQLEGLRLLLTKFPSTWFNFTKHRVTPMPSRGVACFDCHINGHTNAEFQLDPAVRPTLARPRQDTPTIRGNYIYQHLSMRRTIRSLNHFAEVEEYFDGDISIQPKIGGRQLDKESTDRMGDFMALIDFPPAPKLNRFGKLDPEKATEQELRGQKLFFGKAQCAECHPAPYYTDNSIHDLRVEEFYVGRAEGPVKTFSLRGIKDSPPYFHDGRLPTLEDTVEFFNIILQTELTAQEKEDLVAFLRCL